MTPLQRRDTSSAWGEAAASFMALCPLCQRALLSPPGTYRAQRNPKQSSQKKRPQSSRAWLGGETYHLLLGGNEPGLFLQLGLEGTDLALKLGSCLPLVLRQGGLEPLILLLQLVDTGWLVGQMSAETSRVPGAHRIGFWRQILVEGSLEEGRRISRARQVAF